MTLRPQSRSALSLRRLPRSVALAGAALFLAGCPPEEKRPAFPWKTAAVVRPIIPEPLSPSETALPEVDSVSAEMAPPTLRLVPPRIPARPRVSSQPSAAAENGSKSEDGPLIVPQMTDAESAAAQQEISSNLAAAERNLESVRDKKLSASQNDMVNKTKGFIADAHEAVHASDWARARSLARKAQVLSDQLARSL